MAFAAIALGTTVATAGYNFVSSAKKNSQANKINETTERPIYDAPQEIDDVYNFAQSEVNNTTMQDYASEQLQQGLSGGIDAMLKSGGKVDFQTIQGSYGNQLRAALDQMNRSRDQKIAVYNNAAYNKAKSQDTEFQFNEVDPFKDAKQQQAILKQQAEQQKVDAINGLVGGFSNYATAMTKPGQYGENNTAPSVGATNTTGYNPELAPTSAPRAQRATVGSLPLRVPSPQTQPEQGVGYANEDSGGRMVLGFDHWGNPIYSN